MNDPSVSAGQNITLTDVQLASAYYPILMDLALHKSCQTYGELVDAAKHRYPDRPVVQRAIPVSTGRRLEVIRLFTQERDLPDLSALIINKDTGECGSGVNLEADPKHAREQVYAYDWSAVSSDFDGFLHGKERTLTPRKKVKDVKARELMSQYYQAHKNKLPKDVRRHRDAILELIEEGFEAAEAFEQAIKA